MLLVTVMTICAIIGAIDILVLIFFDEDTEAGQMAQSLGVALFCLGFGFLVMRGVISIICDLI